MKLEMKAVILSIRIFEMIYVTSLSQKFLKSRSHRFSADDVPQVKLSNRFSVLHVDQQSTGFLKHVEN